mmetsp:Transcript_30669/g.35391  ORF Transcript_30669/g.35391 Transcript_30669/m.35391 type:complete len:85 (+) Transcript_30669:1380-1634(+)
MSKKFETKPRRNKQHTNIDSKKDISDGGRVQQKSGFRMCVCVSQFLNVRYVTHNRNIICVPKTKKVTHKRPVKTFKVLCLRVSI